MAGIRTVNGKVSGVNPAVSCCRLRQVQSLLCEPGASTPDGILCSLGIESRYNAGCTELAKYLFYGLYGHNPLSLDHSLDDFPEEMLDDVILLIQADRVHLYCNPLNYPYLLPYVSHWRNLHLYCMTPTEYEDEEAAEEFKISSFVTMVQDCYHIGVPYSSQGHMQKFDMFMVEKWPLLQAFALEGIGGGSFFTLRYKLMDVSEQLWQVYNRLDPVSLDSLLSEDLVIFEKQWSQFFSSLELESHLSILELSEAQAGEAFRSYYCHGLISRNITNKSESQQPLVLFGKHSSSQDVENYSFTFPSESHQVRNTGTPGSAATHMIVQCVAPKGPLSCSRTYFFGTTHNPYPGNQPVENRKSDVLLLSQVYWAAVQSVLSGIRSYSCYCSEAKAKDVAENTFLSSLDSLSLSQYRSLLRSKCVFSIQAVNKQGRIIPLTDEQSRYAVKTASMTVSDILENLGSVVFSESFLESSINIQHKDGSVSTDSCYTILTTMVPRYSCWMLEPDVKQSEQIQQLIKNEGDSCLGKVLTSAEAAYVFSSSSLSTPEEGKITFFSEGLLFAHAQYGSFTLSKENITSISLYRPDSVDAVASLILQYNSSARPHLPFPLLSADHTLLFALQPRSKSLRSFCSKVLSVWQNCEESGLDLQLLDQEQLTWTQQNMYSRVQALHLSQEPPVAKRRDCSSSLKTSYSQLPEQDMFLQHFALSSISQEPVLSEHQGALFPSAAAGRPEERVSQTVINIITGLPGSHSEKLCHFLMNRKPGRYVLYRADCGFSDSSIIFSASHLQKFLSSFLQRPPETPPGGGGDHLLILSPGYTDVMDLVQAVLFHPDPQVQTRFSLGSVSACVDPLTCCLEHRFVFPKLLEQCSQGIVSVVVLTGLQSEQQDPVVQHVQQLLHSVNPTAAFIQAPRGDLNRTEDVSVILSKSSFSEAQMLRARYVLYPGWCKGRFFSGSGSVAMTQQRLVFHRPLEKHLFLTRCKALKSSLKSSPFHGNVYNISGKVRFSDSPERWSEVSFNTVSGGVNMVHELSQEDPPTSCFLLFDGVGLSRDRLKDWITLCTKQTPTKKPKKTSLSSEELQNIHMKRRLDPLPPGFFYNGYLYMDLFGERRSFHPNMEDFVNEYLTEANGRIEQFNRRLEQQPQTDLFDP